MIDVNKLLELEAKANHSVNIRLYDNAGWWEGMTEDDGKLFVAMRNSIRELCLEVKALRGIAEVVKEMKGGYLQCSCHAEGTDWDKCDYMKGAYRAFEAAARVVTKEPIAIKVIEDESVREDEVKIVMPSGYETSIINIGK